MGTTRPSARRAFPIHLTEDHRACRREIQRLSLENIRLAKELERLYGVIDDLRGSAEIWIHLYEAQLSRTRRLEASPRGNGRGTDRVRRDT